MTIEPPDLIPQTRIALAAIIERLRSADETEVKAGLEQYQQIVDNFYKENERFMSPSQYRKALQDVMYFNVLVELADHYYADRNFQ